MGCLQARFRFRNTILTRNRINYEQLSVHDNRLLTREKSIPNELHQSEYHNIYVIADHDPQQNDTNRPITDFLHNTSQIFLLFSFFRLSLFMFFFANTSCEPHSTRFFNVFISNFKILRFRKKIKKKLDFKQHYLSVDLTDSVVWNPMKNRSTRSVDDRRWTFDGGEISR